MRSVFVPMTDKNIEKILRGDKTSTLRTQKAANKMGLLPNETGYCYFKNKKFYITNKGLLSIDEAGGRDLLWKTEGFGDDGPMFKSTEDWLEGKGKLFVYEIVPA